MALYPPIVASSMPAFDINNQNGVKVYFSLPNYNGDKRDEIKNVHVTIRNQASNVSVVNNVSDILIKNIQQDELDKIYNRYYISITNSDIVNGFSIDKLYKVQLRFSSVIRSEEVTPADFFTNNLDKFSQWSTVCIIKPINPPDFYIDEFKEDSGQWGDDTDNEFNYAFAQFNGIFKNSYQQDGIIVNSSEVLKSWRLRLYNSALTEENINTLTPLADSKEQLSSAYNYTLDQTAVILQCLLDYEFQASTKYNLVFSIKTKNDYESYKVYSFTYKPVSIGQFTGTLRTFVNEEEGYIKLEYRPSSGDASYTGNAVIRRSDSRHNFLNWRDLKNFEMYGNDTSGGGTSLYQYYDFTAESGIAYKYLIQKRDSRGRRGQPLPDQTGSNKQVGTVGEWEYAFLLESAGNGVFSEARQLKLKYDFQISSYKTNISESKTDTIGSKYPFIRRNGNMYYRSFPITGTITAYMDNVELFTSKSALNDNISIYDDLKEQYAMDVERRYDYTYQRKFREVVEEFLYNSKPKLYKSMQEGNILIKLMEISLTPKNELGRLIYSFSATAYEIGEPSLANLNAYGFIKIGTFNPVVTYPYKKIGQIMPTDGTDITQGIVFKAGQDIIGTGTGPAANSIAAKEHYHTPYNGNVLRDFKINYLRIEVESQPYLIIQDEDGSLRVFDDIDSDGTSDNVDFENPHSKFYQLQATYYNTKTTTDNKQNINVYLGTLFTLNGQQIMISYPNTIYELKDQGLELPANTTLIPAKDTIMSFDYTLSMVYEEDTSKTPKRTKSQIKVGQIIGNYNYSQELINEIRLKYVYKYYEDPKNRQGLVTQSAEKVVAISIDTQPGTVFYAGTKDSQGSSQPTRFVVNETGELNLDPEDVTISINTYRIYGKNFLIGNLNDRSSEEGVSSIEDIKYPKTNDFYKNGSNYYIYYKNQWYNATNVSQEKSFDIQCSVDAMLFYTVHIRRDSF